MQRTNQIHSLAPAIENTQVVRLMRIAQDNGCIFAHNHLYDLLYPGRPKGSEVKMNNLWKLAQEAAYCIWHNGRFILTEKGQIV